MKRARISKTRPEWLAPLDDARDEEILSAAFDVFAQEGFHGATMLEIASRAKASKKTLYARFADKAALFRALLAWGARQSLPENLPPPDADPETALRAHAVQVLTAMMRPESLRLYRIVVGEAERFPEIALLFDVETRRGSVAIVDELARRLLRAKKIGSTRAFGDDFIALLRGDLFYRAASGVVAVPSGALLKVHAMRAVDTLLAGRSL